MLIAYLSYMVEQTIYMAQRQQNVIQTIADYGRQLFAFVRSRVRTDEDAEDIVQDVWYQLINQPELQAIESVSGWLYRVARNRIIDRSRKKRPDLLEDYGSTNENGEWTLPEIMLADDANPESEHLRQLFWDELFAALEELPPNQRNVFVRNELDSMTLQQIADADGVPLKTIISRKRYAVLHLRKRLEDLYNDFLTD